MTEKEGESIGLGNIEEPSVPPVHPDSLTEKEIKKARQRAAKPTVSERLDAAVERHIRDILDQREHLQRENVELRAELDRLKPAYERLEEASSATFRNNFLSTAMVAVGGALISGATYAAQDIPKYVILMAGGSTLLWGIILLMTTTWRSATFDSRMSQPRL